MAPGTAATGNPGEKRGVLMSLLCELTPAWMLRLPRRRRALSPAAPEPERAGRRPEVPGQG